jgi:hypothetical protein
VTNQGATKVKKRSERKKPSEEASKQANKETTAYHNDQNADNVPAR